ncbi:MAG: histidine kinase dimerization/phosphoacceptor domain -containing protein [Phenylobacterium sp.]|uniref:histidine kinase dimerization/phosphoacceptor domain -containing protein n=1 Tax=Phenylobacterium sp. TaxID=1871053 RepID=UPI00271BC556|nr:histidine kinase dimerization/phosphoacceptor domain -containing protein [Phenylobacterium sp.]MDO8410595.1 histidine kinase dimerization/phosphoacceptor domain -containing protein [Phenylobacterium sp.]
MIERRDTFRADSLLTPRAGIDDPFAAAVHATRMSMIIADAQAPDMPIVFANDAFLALSGYARDEVLGRNCRFLQGPDTDPEMARRLAQAVVEGAPINVDILNYSKDGKPFWNALQISPVRNAEGLLVYYIGSQIDVTARKNAEDRLVRDREGLVTVATEQTRAAEQALAERTALLHEVDHRVKNNLQLIGSLLVLQTRRTEDLQTRIALESMLSRVSAIATVHRRLFQSRDLERFDVAAFVRDLVGDVSSSHDKVAIDLDLQSIEIDAAQAAPLALAVNELLDNAFAHGLNERRAGKLSVRVQRQNGHYLIAICDGGPGLPPSGQFEPGFGLTIVGLLAQQLRAELRFEPTNPGVRAILELPVNA